MGCATSKEKICQNCQAPYSPVRRSYSIQVNHHHHHHHHPATKSGDTYHVVALTSSTLGSLNLDPSDFNRPPASTKFLGERRLSIEDRNLDEPPAGNGETAGGDEKKSTKEEFEMGMIEAKSWSLMINEKIPKITPKTPIRTPPGEPETINAWEMMEGLDDISPLRPAPRHFRSFSFHVPSTTLSSLADAGQPTPRVKEDRDPPPPSPPNPPCLDPDDPSPVPEFDPGVIATFRKALEELPPANPFHLNPTKLEKHPTPPPAARIAPRGNEPLIVYFTSLRGVRKTYEDCCHVRVVLKGLGVRVDERDVSMHSGFKEELKELLGEGLVGIGLPRVFIGRRYIGGADDVRRLNEEGILEKLVEGCEALDSGGGQNGLFCEACGDVRFVPCETCSGSCKVYYEEGEDYEEVKEFEESGFHRCPDCNENGLVRCPICCD